jgi:hypothetical protein
MNNLNQMQDKILSTLHSVVDAWELEWVEIVGGPCQGTIRLMQAGGFRTMLKIEYEFQPERYRLLVYREGKHIFGRCNIDYDDGMTIEQILAQFRCLLPQTRVSAPETHPVSAAMGTPAAALTRQPSHPNFRRTLCRSLGPHA